MSSRKTSHNREGHSPERQRRISQYSKEIANTGHEGHHSEKSERFRRISQHSHSNADGGDNHEKSERSRRISHYTRDAGHLKDATLRGQGQGHHHQQGRGRAGSKREHDHHSEATSGDHHIHPVVEFENTYRLEPEVMFLPGKVKAIIHQVLVENLKGQKYDRNLMGSRCLVLSDIIKEKVRQLQLPRYKIVSMVLIGERKDQAMLVSSRCLWNHNYDNFASCDYSNVKDNVCAVGMVFAVYQE